MAIEPQFHEVVKEGPIVIWKFSNPPQNLRSIATGEELRLLVEEFDKDPELRVGIITSATPGKFIQHFDVASLLEWAEGFSNMSEDEFKATMTAFPEPTAGLSALTRKPIICSINGPVEGGGCELAMYCDFRFIARDAFMGQPEINGGFPPGEGVPRMIQLIGLGKTLELCMTGRRIYPDEAERIGLVNRACDPQDLDAEVMKFALELAAKAPEGLAATKESIYRAAEMTVVEGLKVNRDLFMKSLRTEDALSTMRLYVAADQNGEKLMNAMMEADGDPEKALALLKSK